MNHVITITRQFGSMGRHIGMQVAEIMGYKYLDRDILEDTAKTMDVSLERLLLLEDKNIQGYHRMAYPFGFGDGVMQRKMFQVQSELVKQYARTENCVIIGRCADYVLKDWDNVFSVFIYAPYLDRIANSVEKLGIKASEAKIIVDEVDYARELCYEKFTKTEFNTTNYRDLLINSSILGRHRTADLIAGMAKKYFKEG
ncbi:MAG: cytidylate kinase-like family protein [Lachnospiraceae bacterium]|nr:cytidylate kinase-like family protein [Lachnospiraceae bacterium]